ncbi:MAG: hypothetical protein HC822_07600 [Oscillochloris sp.]|nr:hypothetical protein [Oscillochloris sp.]
MFLGTRRIRSAGRNSGSIEVTLPAQLQELEGLECQLLVRDGPRPEIVLQPDLALIQEVIGDTWHGLQLALSEAGELGDLGPADAALTIFPGGPWTERPALALVDLLAIRRRGVGAPDALARVLAALALIAARRLGIRPALDSAFADVVAYLLTGYSSGLGADFERGMARQRFVAAAGEPAGPPLDSAAWRRVGPGLCAIVDQWQIWQEQPARYQAVRDRWYRALTLEIGPF